MPFSSGILIGVVLMVIGGIIFFTLKTKRKLATGVILLGVTITIFTFGFITLAVNAM